MIPYPYHNLEVLEENSKHYTCLCPFHKEEEGSFTVNKGGRFPLWFKCWGCGVQGSPKEYAKHFKMNPDQIKYVPIKKEKPVVINWEDRLRWDDSKIVRDEFAKYIGISSQTLIGFRLGYYQGKFLVPLFDTAGKILGIQEHWWEKDKHIKKLQVHSKHGIFMPEMKFDTEKPLIINEGFSDTACSVDMEFQAIGKYNALHKLDKKIIEGLKKFKRVLIVADNDDAGKQGAKELGLLLPNSYILTPPDPYNDEREWMLASGREEVQLYLRLILEDSEYLS